MPRYLCGDGFRTGWCQYDTSDSTRGCISSDALNTGDVRPMGPIVRSWTLPRPDRLAVRSSSLVRQPRYAKRRVGQALAALSPVQRQALMMVSEPGATYHSVASTLGWTEEHLLHEVRDALHYVGESLKILRRHRRSGARQVERISHRERHVPPDA